MRNAPELLVSPHSTFLVFLCLSLALVLSPQAQSAEAQEEDRRTTRYLEENNQIRRDKFDLVLPQIMRERDIDMWIHVMRLAIPDAFGAEELGSTSGVFVFTDRGGDRIERAILGRRWGARQRARGGGAAYRDPIEELGAYDIIGAPIFVREPLAGPMIEYDFRFKGLREFVAARDPQRIALNYKGDLGEWETYTDFGGARDGLSYTDYRLLAEELGDKYASRLVSSEYVMMDYILRKVPSEIQLLKTMSAESVERVKNTFSEIVPGATSNRETVFRRMSKGLSQRGRSEGWENSVVQEGDIVASPETGIYAYVLREGETEPPPEIQKLWEKYLTVDRILVDTIRAGLTPREIIGEYTRKFEEEGIIVRDPQLHMFVPKNDFAAYSEGFDPSKTHLSVDAHGMMKGARNRPNENYLGPRIGSYGPDWTKDIPLPANYHFVLEYFFYMPSPAGEGQDQYLLWWDHEPVIATANGVEYLSPPQKELYLIQ